MIPASLNFSAIAFKFFPGIRALTIDDLSSFFAGEMISTFRLSRPSINKSAIARLWANIFPHPFREGNSPTQSNKAHSRMPWYAVNIRFYASPNMRLFSPPPLSVYYLLRGFMPRYSQGGHYQPPVIRLMRNHIAQECRRWTIPTFDLSFCFCPFKKYRHILSGSLNSFFQLILFIRFQTMWINVRDIRNQYF